MQRPSLPKRALDEPVLGKKVAFTRTFTEADVALFIGVIWDVNPYHTDEAFAQRSPFQARIAPGLLAASMLTHIGGLWAYLATEMHFEFVKPVFIPDTITAEVEVIEIDEKNRVRLRLSCVNTRGEEVLRGECVGIPGSFEA